MKILTEKERADRNAKLAIARRQADLRSKNPITHAWDAFEKKIDPAQGGSEAYVVQKFEKTERPREDRADRRAERKFKRLHDEVLQLDATKVLVAEVAPPPAFAAAAGTGSPGPRASRSSSLSGLGSPDVKAETPGRSVGGSPTKRGNSISPQRADRAERRRQSAALTVEDF